MNMQFEELPLPRYIPEPAPEHLTAALDLYGEIMRDDCGKGLRGRRGVTLYDLRTALAYITRDTETRDVVAIASYNPGYRLKGAAYINGLVVHPEYRGQGIGEFTIQQLAQETAERGLRTLRVRSFQSAIGFYAKLGFLCDEIVPADPTLPFMSLDVTTAREATRSRLHTSSSV